MRAEGLVLMNTAQTGRVLPTTRKQLQLELPACQYRMTLHPAGLSSGLERGLIELTCARSVPVQPAQKRFARKLRAWLQCVSAGRGTGTISRRTVGCRDCVLSWDDQDTF